MRCRPADRAAPGTPAGREPAAAPRRRRRAARPAIRRFPGLVGPGDALVLNDTRVIKARLAGRKASGGAVEIFVERLLGPREAWR